MSKLSWLFPMSRMDALLNILHRESFFLFFFLLIFSFSVSVHLCFTDKYIQMYWVKSKDGFL